MSFIPLIINGDDFGYSESVNRGIIRAHREGVLTSASLMVNERAAAQAVELARENPGLAVGLHLVLSLGASALPHLEIPHITDERGRFPDSSFKAGLKYYFSPAARREMRIEMRAQFERFAATGLPFSHVDGHTHLHMHPTVFDELIRLCLEFNVRRVRIVRGEMRLSLRIDRRNLPIKLVWGTVFNLLGRRCDDRLNRQNFVRAEKVYGLLQTGNMNEEYLLELLRKIDKAQSEIYLHPLAPDANESEQMENPGGIDEFRALVSPRLRRALTDAGFFPATYKDLNGTARDDDAGLMA